MHACMHSFCVLLLFQCRPASNDAVIAAKDSQIASLQAALMEKEKILQNMSRVRASLYQARPLPVSVNSSVHGERVITCVCNTHLRLTSNIYYTCI